MLVSVHRSGESANTVRLLTSHIDGEEVGTCVDVSRIDGDIQHVQGIEQRGACLMYGNYFRDSKLLLLIFNINGEEIGSSVCNPFSDPNVPSTLEPHPLRSLDCLRIRASGFTFGRFSVKGD